MIIVRSPVRISLGGGGTDLPSYYRKNEGHLIAAAINKYVYISINSTFSQNFFLKYSDIEKVEKIDKIKHNIIRETLKYLKIKKKNIEITSTSDMPAGTGLGSSGSFTAALIKSLMVYQNQHIDQQLLAKKACQIEIDILKEPVGKQDQYISAIGGISSFVFKKNDSVVYKPLNLSSDVILKMEDNLLLFFTGLSRSASKILKDQNEKTKRNNKEMEKNLNFIKDIGYHSKALLEKGNLIEFGKLLDEHWLKKMKRSKGISNAKIESLYEFAKKNGAIGGKLVGAGGGGFLMFYTEQPTMLRNAMKTKGIYDTRFSFDFEGTKVIHS